MDNSIGDETVAYIGSADTSWCVSLRDGGGLAVGVFTIPARTYHDTVEEAYQAAQRRVKNGRADRVEMNPVVARLLDK